MEEGTTLEAEVNLTDAQKLVIKLVRYAGKDWIAMKKWKKWTQDQTYHADSKFNFFVEKNVFGSQVLPILIELCKD